jgi:hypothetical protein
MAITWGYNKDHRPDLKQLLYILTVARDGAVPLYFQVASGNVADDQTHRATWDLLCRLTGRRNFLYVADCKLATTENMAYIHQRQGRFLTVLPRSRSEDRAFRDLPNLAGAPQPLLCVGDQDLASRRTGSRHPAREREPTRWSRGPPGPSTGRVVCERHAS